MATNRLQLLEESANIYEKSLNLEDYKNRERIHQQKLLHNIKIITEDKAERFDALVSQCTKNKKFCEDIEKEIQKDLEKKENKENVKKHNLTSTRLVIGENLLLAYELAANLHYLDPSIRKGTSLKILKENATKILPASRAVALKMMKPAYLSQTFIKCINYISFGKYKSQNDWPSIFDCVCISTTGIYLPDHDNADDHGNDCDNKHDNDDDDGEEEEEEEHDNDDEDIKMISKEDKLDLENFVEDKEKLYSLQNEITKLLQEANLTLIETNVAQEFIESTLNSIFQDLIDFILISYRNLIILIEDLRIPANKEKEEAEKWLIHLVEQSKGGVTWELQENICPYFKNDGMEDLIETQYYEDIAKAFTNILKPTIENKIQQYTQ